jgi:hypothetical protein
MSFSIDFSHVEDFEPLPGGVYEVVVSSITESEQPGDSGYNYLTVEMTVADGEFENRKLFTVLSLSPKAAFKIKEFLIATGEDPADLVAEDYEFDPTEYEGQVLQVSVTVKNVDGVMRNRVTSFVNPNAEVAEEDKPRKERPTTAGARNRSKGPKVR